MSGKKSRNKGHRAEIEWVHIFRDLGYSNARSSREESNFLDGLGIDIVNVPINVQVKAGSQRGLNYSEELRQIREKILQKAPKLSDNILILAHRKDGTPGKKRSPEQDLVIMSRKDFLYIFKKAF